MAMYNRVFGTQGCLPVASLEDAENQHNRIFGQGCDARLNRQSIIHNPYPNTTPAFRTWQNGWRDVDRFWGADVDRRWCYQELGSVLY